MKVLVYFQPSPKHDNFEGARMRKTIKGALEVIDLKYTSNLYDEYDVAHFMSPDDESKLAIALEKKVPIVVSALFGEDDPATRFLNHKNKNGEVVVSLKPKALRLLNKASLVLVPCESAKEFLIRNGVNRPIETIVPGVNLARFNFSREDEKELFYRYFREDKNKKLVLAMGEYTNNMEGIYALNHSLMMIRPEGLSFRFDPSKNRAKYFMTFIFSYSVYCPSYLYLGNLFMSYGFLTGSLRSMLS